MRQKKTLEINIILLRYFRNDKNNNKKRNQLNIEERSDLLEKVFADFNIQISVVNVKLGPVVIFTDTPSSRNKNKYNYQSCR